MGKEEMLTETMQTSKEENGCALEVHPREVS